MNPDSALIWFPKIEAAGLPVPKTVMIPYDHSATLAILDGEPSPEFNRLCAEVRSSLMAVDGAPAFLRTDLASAKHDGPRSYKIESRESAHVNVVRTIEDSEMKFMFEYPSAMMVRQFLKLPAPFTAFRGLPISREFRIFADGTRVLCGPHPYWPADAVEDHLDSHPSDLKRPNWREQLADMQRLSPHETEVLSAMAIKAAAAIDGKEWSVDFCLDDAGVWYLIDMATGKESWHWPDCERAMGRI